MEKYHPQRKRNEILDPKKIESILKSEKYITMALCDENTPYAVTLSYGYDSANNCLYFHCANTGEKLDFIKKNNKTCATIIKNNGYIPTKCDHDYESLVIRGNIDIITDLAEKKHGLQIILNHLEKDPKPIFDRNIKNDDSYNSVTILKLNMDSIIGKQYIG